MPTLGHNDARYAEQLNYWEARSTHMLCNNNVAEVGFEISIPSTTMSGDADLLSLHKRIMNVLHYAVPAGERLRLHLEVAPLEDRLLARYGAELKSDNPAARLVSEATTNLLNSGRRKEILNEYRAYVTCTMRIDRSRWQRKRAFGVEEIATIDNRAWTLRGQLQAALQQAGLSPIPFSPTTSGFPTATSTRNCAARSFPTTGHPSFTCRRRCCVSTRTWPSRAFGHSS